MLTGPRQTQIPAAPFGQMVEAKIPVSASLYDKPGLVLH